MGRAFRFRCLTARPRTQTLARAFANLGQYFLAGENLTAAEGCRRAAIRACDADAAATALAAQLDEEHPELGELSDEL
ncbi:MAG: hypothetical protein ACLTSX_02860 [Collinsella sp.]